MMTRNRIHMFKFGVSSPVAPMLRLGPQRSTTITTLSFMSSFMCQSWRPMEGRLTCHPSCWTFTIQTAQVSATLSLTISSVAQWSMSIRPQSAMIFRYQHLNGTLLECSQIRLPRVRYSCHSLSLIKSSYLKTRKRKYSRIPSLRKLKSKNSRLTSTS